MDQREKKDELKEKLTIWCANGSNHMNDKFCHLNRVIIYA
jgi:hypothetical protein